jgi:Helix-turn-helix domain
VILHRDGSVRRIGAVPKPASVPEVAQVLRQARSAQGVDLETVSRQTGIPLEQLQDLESGTVDRLPDRVAILKALSHYAAYLHLPGDQFVMTMVEHWPVAATNGSPVVVVHDGPVGGAYPDNTAVGTLAPPGRPMTDDLSTRAVPLSMPVGAPLPTSIGLPVFEGRHNSTAQVPTVMADTGRTQAIRGDRSDGIGMVLVRALVVVSLILVLIGTAWLVINRVHPQWLADLRIPYTSSGVNKDVGQTTHATTSSTPAAKPKTPAMKLVSANGTEATFSVNTPVFGVRISASGGDTWVQANGPLSTKPSFEGILKSGQSQLVSANHQLVVRIGSTAAHIAVQVGKHVIGTYVPPGAPFTMTFTTQ